MAYKNEQLCWTCQNARADLCCWMRDMTPVQGWDAYWLDEITLPSGHVRQATYSIKKCPNYVSDTIVKQQPIVERRFTRLFEAIEKLQKKEIKIRRR